MKNIYLPYGNNSFHIDDLVAYLKSQKVEFIIQGHTKCKFDQHPKKHSLDYWLRFNYAKNKDTMQAVSEVVDQIVKTSLFEAGHFNCPSTGRKCKGIKLKTA